MYPFRAARASITMLAVLVSSVGLVPTIHAASPTQIDIILDASGSMGETIGSATKMAIAKEVFGAIVTDIAAQDGLRVGLRIYGRKGGSCTDSAVEVAVGPVDATSLGGAVAAVAPKGKTPIAYSLEQAVGDFDAGLPGPKVIILLTDGEESCGGDPCAVAEALQSGGVVSTIHVVGFGMDAKGLESLQCVAKPFGGLVLGAKDAKELEAALVKVVVASTAPTLEVRAADDAGASVLSSFEVCPAGKEGEIVASGDTSMESKGAAALPSGTYDVKITNTSTGDVIWKRGVTVEEGSLAKVEVVFAERTLEVRLKDAQGSYLYGDVYVFDQEGVELKHADTSMGQKATITLLPGVYDVKAVDSESKKEQIIQDVDLTTTKTITKEVVF